MTAPTKYSYQNKLLTIKEVHELYGRTRCGLTWVREKLRDHTVEEVLKMRPMTREEISRAGAKKSPWGANTFDANTELREAKAKAEAREIALKSPFEKMRYNELSYLK